MHWLGHVAFRFWMFCACVFCTRWLRMLGHTSCMREACKCVGFTFACMLHVTCFACVGDACLGILHACARRAKCIFVSACVLYVSCVRFAFSCIWAYATHAKTRNTFCVHFGTHFCLELLHALVSGVHFLAFAWILNVCCVKVCRIFGNTTHANCPLHCSVFFVCSMARSSVSTFWHVWDRTRCLSFLGFCLFVVLHALVNGMRFPYVCCLHVECVFCLAFAAFWATLRMQTARWLLCALCVNFGTQFCLGSLARIG